MLWLDDSEKDEARRAILEYVKEHGGNPEDHAVEFILNISMDDSDW